MPTINLKSDVKRELEELMLHEIKKNIRNPKILTLAINNKYGYTHSDFVEKLIKNYKRIKVL